MIKVLWYDKPLHQLQEELTLLEKLGQQIVSVVPDPPRPPSSTVVGHFSTYTTGSNGGWWITVRIPDDDAMNRAAFNLGVEACAECVESRACKLRGQGEDSLLADALDLSAIELRMMKRTP